MKIGLIADIHGDLEGFQAALTLLNAHEVTCILCAGDIADRGPEADAIVRLIKDHNIACIKGNHDDTVVAHQEKWRAADNQDELIRLGRVINDETVDFLATLPDYAVFRFGQKRLLMAHGTPYSDVVGIFPETRQGILNRLA